MSKGAFGAAGDAFAGQIMSVALSVAAVGVVGLLVWNKIFGAQTATAVVDNTIQASKDIASQLPGTITDLVTGTNDSTYITTAQQKALAAAALAAHQAAIAQGN